MNNTWDHVLSIYKDVPNLVSYPLQSSQNPEQRNQRVSHAQGAAGAHQAITWVTPDFLCNIIARNGFSGVAWTDPGISGKHRGWMWGCVFTNCLWCQSYEWLMCMCCHTFRLLGSLASVVNRDPFLPVVSVTCIARLLVLSIVTRHYLWCLSNVWFTCFWCLSNVWFTSLCFQSVV